MVHLLTPRGSIPYAQDYLDRADVGARGDCMGYEDLPHRIEYPWGQYVFTGINRLGPASVEMLAELSGQLEIGTGLPPLNHPRKTLRRLELLQALHREGLNDFRAYGAWEDFSQARFPVFVRPREQDGGSPPLLYSKNQVVRAIGKELMAGWSLRDVLVVEFEDTASRGGLFRKYSAYVVGSRIIPFSLYIGSNWVLRSDGAVDTPEGIEEERSFIEENPHHDQLARIFSIAETQFGRIDYSLKDGRIQTWEINTLPLLRRPPDSHPRPDDLSALRKPSKALFRGAYSSAWRELLSIGPPGSPVRPTITADTLSRARVELDCRGATAEPTDAPFPRLRWILRPFKRVLKPLAARTLYPLLGRRARRAAGN